MLHSTDEDLTLHLQCNSAKKGNHTLIYLFTIHRVVLAERRRKYYYI